MTEEGIQAIGVGWWLGALTTLGFFAMKIAFAFAVCSPWVAAKRSGLLDLLACTPMGGGEGLIKGHQRSLRQRYLLPWCVFIGFGLVALLCQGWFAWNRNAGETGPSPGIAVTTMGLLLWAQASELGEGMLDFIALYYWGVWLSLTVSKPAQAPFLVCLIVLVAPSVIVLVPNIIISVVLLVVARRRVQKGLREMITAPSM